jgi:hypothetical protein
MNVEKSIKEAHCGCAVVVATSEGIRFNESTKISLSGKGMTVASVDFELDEQAQSLALLLVVRRMFRIIFLFLFALIPLLYVAIFSHSLLQVLHTLSCFACFCTPQGGVNSRAGRAVLYFFVT